MIMTILVLGLATATIVLGSMVLSSKCSTCELIDLLENEIASRN